MPGGSSEAQDECRNSANGKWCRDGCRACDVQAKTRPSSGYSDVHVRIVSGRRKQVKEALRDPTFYPKFVQEMSSQLSDANRAGPARIKMMWEVQPCYGFDVSLCPVVFSRVCRLPIPLQGPACARFRLLTWHATMPHT